MKKLKELIEEKGEVLPGDVIKVDCFLNHQIDVDVIDLIGKEFATCFSNLKPTKILTIETSGVAIAQATSLNLEHQKVVFAKKGNHFNMSDDVYASKEKSFTTGIEYSVRVSKEYLDKSDKVLIVDDFLANGEAMESLLDICKQAKAEVVGIGIVIGKMYLPGYERIKKQCNNIEVLAKIKNISDDNTIMWE